MSTQESISPFRSSRNTKPPGHKIPTLRLPLLGRILSKKTVQILIRPHQLPPPLPLILLFQNFSSEHCRSRMSDSAIRSIRRRWCWRGRATSTCIIGGGVLMP